MRYLVCIFQNFPEGMTPYPLPTLQKRPPPHSWVNCFFKIPVNLISRLTDDHLRDCLIAYMKFCQNMSPECVAECVFFIKIPLPTLQTRPQLYSWVNFFLDWPTGKLKSLGLLMITGEIA